MPSTVVPLADFRARYAEFSAVADATVDLYLEDAEADTSASWFGTWHARAISALAAHRLTLAFDSLGNAISGSGQNGALAAASADGVSSTYVVPQGMTKGDSVLWSTSYGQSFMSLRSRGGPSVFVAG